MAVPIITWVTVVYAGKPVRVIATLVPAAPLVGLMVTADAGTL
jgi:hypothetical protein